MHYVNVTPMVNKATATYLSLQVINAKPMTNMAGHKFPRTLKSFRVCVRVKIFFRIQRSANAPDILMLSQKIMYGNDESKPFYNN